MRFAWNLVRESLPEAFRYVTIAAPYASMKVASLLLPAIRDAAARGVSVRLIVDEPSGMAARERLSAVLSVLREVGCEAEMGRLTVTGIAVIDGRVAWYGTLPLLALPREGDCSLRIVSAEVAADLCDVLRECTPEPWQSVLSSAQANASAVRH